MVDQLSVIVELHRAFIKRAEAPIDDRQLNTLGSCKCAIGGRKPTDISTSGACTLSGAYIYNGILRSPCLDCSLDITIVDQDLLFADLRENLNIRAAPAFPPGNAERIQTRLLHIEGKC